MGRFVELPHRPIGISIRFFLPDIVPEIPYLCRQTTEPFMKVLMIYAREFSYEPSVKSLANYPDVSEGNSYRDVQVVCVQVESEDTENLKAKETKLVKLIKWLAKKNETRRVLLHSFAHLSESKASPGVSKDFFDKVELRLKNAGYEVNQTPFGYFLDLKLDAPGKSSARVFKSI